MIRTLYLCYFGLREPLVQTQVLPYLRQLAGGGVDVSLLTFEPGLREKWTKEELTAETARLAADGIRWFQLPYHKRPSAIATAYDIVAGAREATRIARRHDIDVLHARAHVPMAMAMLAARRLNGCRIIFDIRGLMAEEYADAGIWQENSTTFRAVKKLERAGIRRADAVVVLTRRMRDWLVEQRLADARKIEVIPCCVDFSRYADAGDGTGQSDDDAARSDDRRARERRSQERFEIVYAGSATGLYLLEEMARFVAELRAQRPDAFFRILTMSPKEAAAAVLRGAGLSDEDFWIGGVAASDVPKYLAHARLGLSFRKPTFSQIAASPTKIPEYLAAGLPVVSNAGIGDTDDLLEREAVGVVVREFDRASLARAADDALRFAARPETKARSITVAREHFDLASVGGVRYRNVYRRLEEQG